MTPTAKKSKKAPKDAPLDTLLCPHCHRPDWRRAPGLEKAYTFIAAHPDGTTTKALAKHLKVRVTNGSLKVARLLALKLITLAGQENGKTGGHVNTYKVT